MRGGMRDSDTKTKRGGINGPDSRRMVLAAVVGDDREGVRQRILDPECNGCKVLHTPTVETPQTISLCRCQRIFSLLTSPQTVSGETD